MQPDYSPRILPRMPLPLRARVEALEREIERLPQADCPVWHFFAPGLYARKMLIRAGTVLTGAVHRTEHLCVISGDIEVTTDHGVCRITDVHAILNSTPGTKRAGFAHADTYWTTVHASSERDLDKLVRELTESENSQLLGGADNEQAARGRLEG
ncbi:hypothetical protein [Paraburkholderia sp. GAS82]|uniref:hypothetical protein n=1 Tax=Paraburkholderia sp. GAS82 TaxID=3035137 RepID=UPI003D2258B2